jgi:hypothetical protein
MYEKGQVRDILYEFINHLETLQADSGFGDLLKNDEEIFFENCIAEVEDYIEAFEE